MAVVKHNSFNKNVTNIAMRDSIVKRPNGMEVTVDDVYDENNVNYGPVTYRWTTFDGGKWLTSADINTSQQIITNLNIEEKTYDELFALTPTDNTLYWYSDAKLYVYGDTNTNKWRYVHNNYIIRKTGCGIGPAGVWNESWEDDMSTILSRWYGSLINDVKDTSLPGRWNIRSGSTPSGNTGPSGASDATYYIYSETSSGGHNTDFKFKTDYFRELTRLEFDYMMRGISIGTVKVSYLTAGTWHELWSLSGNQGNDWLYADIDTTGLKIEKIMFEHINASGYAGDVAFDDIIFTSI